ncbi:MAG: hypothetical protein WCJ30_18530, partial [Deltaproteobacteria bacterium]
MGYRGSVQSGAAAELRVPRHSRRAIAVASLVAIAALLLFAGMNLHVVRIDCRYDASDAGTGRCTFTRIAGMRISRLSGRFEGLAVLDRQAESSGGYELVGLERGARFVFGPVANTGQIDAMRADIERLSRAEAGTGRQGARVVGTFVNQRSAWLGWLCGVGAIAIATAALARLARITVVSMDRSRGELRWREENGEEQSLPVHVIRGYALDDEADVTTLVAIVPGGRVPI